LLSLLEGRLYFQITDQGSQPIDKTEPKPAAATDPDMSLQMTQITSYQACLWQHLNKKYDQV
jgi:hypothetical protein